MRVPSSQPDPSEQRRRGAGDAAPVAVGRSRRCALPAAAAAAASKHKGSGCILLPLSSTPVPAAMLQGAPKKRQDAATRSRTPR